jgi:LysM repeat protein
MQRVMFFKKPAGRILLLAFLVMTLFLIAARPAEAQGFGVYHIVQRGETLSQIAKNYGTTVQAIQIANPQISNPNLIYAGQTIFVPFGQQPPPPPPPPPPPTTPPPPPTTTCRAYHYVLPGQTLLMISRMYGVDPFAIARANNIFNLNLIYAGTTLCIP